MVNQIAAAGAAPVLTVGTSPKSAPTRAPAARTVKAPSTPVPGSQEVAVAQINQHLQQAQTEMRLQVDTGSGRTVFQVVQQGSGEVVLQVPSEEVLGMSRRLREMEGQPGASGTLVDKRG